MVDSVISNAWMRMTLSYSPAVRAVILIDGTGKRGLGQWQRGLGQLHSLRETLRVKESLDEIGSFSFVLSTVSVRSVIDVSFITDTT